MIDKERRIRASPEIEGKYGYPSIKQPEIYEANAMKQRKQQVYKDMLDYQNKKDAEINQVRDTLDNFNTTN